MIFYSLKNDVMSCEWNHLRNPYMRSNDKYFISTPGINVKLDRRYFDTTDVSDCCYIGMQTNKTYPQVYHKE